MSKLIGTNPNQVPTNADLGTMAYMDYDAVAPVITRGRKNILINGDFKVSQRGDYTTPVAIVNGIYYLDRWRSYSPTASGTVQQTSVTINGVEKKAIKITKTADSGGECLMEQRVETLSLDRYSEVTFSALVRSNTNTAALRVYNGTSWSQVNHSGSGEWERLKITFIAGQDFNGQRCPCQLFTLNAPNGTYLEATEAQLELGSVATPFEHRSYGEELALCERYYQRIEIYYESLSGHCWNGNNARVPFEYRTEMRANPAVYVPPSGTSVNQMSPLTASLSWPAEAYTNAGTHTAGGITKQKAYVSCTGYSGFSTGNSTLLYSNGGAFITLDAEL